MDTLTYTCPPELASVAAKAAGVWNDVMRDLVRIEQVPVGTSPNITIVWSADLRTPQHPQRIGNCTRIAPDTWLIRLDSLRKWAISPWARFWGLGEDAHAALVHELGHVFNLPHSADPSHVMHTAIGGTGNLSKAEKVGYRAKFLQNLEDEA